jgi:predicted transposase/invertase (TIGR01784 family)
MGVNSQYNASVFSLLFGHPNILRELYSAIEGVPLDPAIPIQINTLSNVLFMDRINDISFAIGDKLVILIEHQSTINPNMPIRLLMYIARVYEKIIGSRNIYSGKKLLIPRPEFIVLYNGKDTYPDTKTLTLSEAFEEAVSLGLAAAEKTALELVVKVYNINQGRNESLIKRSQTLNGYSAFIAKVRELEQALSREEAMEGAIKYCIEHNILKTFLEENASEVVNMLITEWNWDEALAVREEEGREKRNEEIARNAIRALNEGIQPEIVRKITGLDMDTIKRLAGKNP